MKKIFRFQYESCNGTCYHPSPSFFTELKKASKDDIKSIVNKIVQAHDSTCDDPNQRFGIDYDEKNDLYIGSFMDNGRLDLFSDKSFLSLANTLSSHVIHQNTYRKTPKGFCRYGENGEENLAELIIRSIAS